MPNPSFKSSMRPLPQVALSCFFSILIFIKAEASASTDLIPLSISGRCLQMLAIREAQRNNVQGKVIVKFVVEKDGHVGKVIVLKGDELGNHLGDAAVAAIRALKKFIPGMQNGRPVRVYLTIPINFTLGASK